ncbi:T9SS type A sorting domain-containing protein [Winogradskyella sp.]|uniref:T9SS type A sorting domain-containing protein n=1 Tax=Winogradskyella sp. TaxID=1883156 RepID=UPI002631A57E|nr:T9SS type A sorting domain-containing protein [Winogradskyella sp.]
MKQKLQFKTMIKVIITLSLFFTGCLISSAQGATFTSVNPATDVLTITNTGSSMVNITDYWLCLGPGTYVRVGTVTPISGDYMLSADESVTLSYNVTEAQDGLSLFSTNTFMSSDPSVLVSYVQWGAANQPRVGQAVTAGGWDDVNNFVSGNGPYTTVNGGSAAAWSTCEADAAAIQIVGGGTEATICANDGAADPIDVEIVGMGVGANNGWVITDQGTGEILGLPPGPPFDLEGVFAGVCDVWYIRYEDGLTGLAMGNNVSDLMGCFDLSNPVSITRNAPDAAAIQIVGGGTEATICANDGAADPIDVEIVGMGVGANNGWVITDQGTGEILGLPPGPPFDLEGVFAGVCDVWYIRYEDGLTGLAMGNNVSDLMGCFDLSNPVSITRNAPDAAAIQIVGGGTEASICADDAIPDPINVEIVGTGVGANNGWVITDQGTGEILGLPPGPPFDLEGVFAGVCDVWYIRYEDGLTGLAMGNNVSDLSGCFDLSNPISITRLAGTDCDALSIDEFDTAFDFKVFPNPSKDVVNISFNVTRISDIEIQVIDMLGKQVYTINATNEEDIFIDISNLENGTYFMNITDIASGNRIVKRMIKN